jgi:hypothetical protein
MWEQVKESFVQSFGRIAAAAAGLVPGVIAMVLVLVVSLVLAVLVRLITRRLLTGIGFDRLVHRWGFTAADEWPPSRTPTAVAARLGFWLLLLLGAVVGLTGFDATLARELALRLLEFLPQVVAAGAIFVVGLVAARFLERNARIGAVNMQLRSARVLGLGIKWLVILLATAMALDHLGIGGSIVAISFGIVFGGVVLAAALAVGLGAREAVARALERRREGEGEPEPKDEDAVRHL